uniref:Calmodulin n=1 Tax=Plectus sambesii TaxID=2011161 RepID=A0A914W637_9BILA
MYGESTDSYDPYSYYSPSIATSASAAYFFENALSDNKTVLTLDDFLEKNSIYEEILTNEKAKFALVDTNNDGKVTEKEQTAYVQKLKDEEKNAQLYRFRNYIDMYDKGDGKMQAPELEVYLEERLNLKPIENVTTAKLMDPFDTDHDGALTADGLFEFFYNQPLDKLEQCYNDDYSSSTSNYDSSTIGSSATPDYG